MLEPLLFLDGGNFIRELVAVHSMGSRPGQGATTVRVLPLVAVTAPGHWREFCGKRSSPMSVPGASNTLIEWQAEAIISASISSRQSREDQRGGIRQL